MVNGYLDNVTAAIGAKEEGGMGLLGVGTGFPFALRCEHLRSHVRFTGRFNHAWAAARISFGGIGGSWIRGETLSRCRYRMICVPGETHNVG